MNEPHPSNPYTLSPGSDPPPFQEGEPDLFCHEGVGFEGSDTTLTPEEIQTGNQEHALDTIYGEETNRLLFTSMGDFWQRVEKGDSPDIALCELIRDKMVSELTHKIEQVQVLTQMGVRDHYTYSHTLHVSALSIALGIKAGLSKKEIQDIGLAAILHDLGKYRIPKHIMFKPNRLTEQEFEVMKLHPGFGYQIIKEDLKLPEHIARPALEHQEMHSGGGYPQNLSGNEIHPLSQIVKIADVYEALTAKRPYKNPIPSSKAIEIMLSEGSKSFNPELLDMFVTLANYQPLEIAPANR
ncbi:MAG: HD-GYP domain-containing protein [Cyanobacteria bacterium]|nr:HD-GYP domain-containing protein [Cyanobacteriota bacterium]